MLPTDDEIAKLNRDDLVSLLTTYAQYPPEDMLPDSRTWGHGMAGALWSKLRSLPIASEFDGIVDELLQSHDPQRVWLGTALVAGRTVNLEVLEQALARVPAMEDLPPDCMHKLRQTWAFAVAAERIPWNDSMRDLLRQDWARPLLDAAMVRDHIYVLDHLPELLDQPGWPPVSRFASSVEGNLSLEEGRRLQAELRARQDKWGEKWTDDLVQAIQWYIDNNRLPSGPVRW